MAAQAAAPGVARDRLFAALAGRTHYRLLKSTRAQPVSGLRLPGRPDFGRRLSGPTCGSIRFGLDHSGHVVAVTSGRWRCRSRRRGRRGAGEGDSDARRRRRRLTAAVTATAATVTAAARLRETPSPSGRLVAVPPRSPAAAAAEGAAMPVTRRAHQRIGRARSSAFQPGSRPLLLLPGRRHLGVRRYRASVWPPLTGTARAPAGATLPGARSGTITRPGGVTLVRSARSPCTPRRRQIPRAGDRQRHRR